MKSLSLILFIVIALSGCITSPTPFFSIPDVITDDRIVGTYEDGTVVSRPDRQSFEYRIRVKDGQYSMSLRAVIFKLGDMTFFDLFPEDEWHSEDHPDRIPLGIAMLRLLVYQRLHVIAQATITDQGLALTHCDNSCADALFRRDSSLKSRLIGGRLILTSPDQVSMIKSMLRSGELKFGQPKMLTKRHQ